MAERKSNLWDDKVTELVIPELESGEPQEETLQDQISAPEGMQAKMVDLQTLEKDLTHNVPSKTEDGVDLSMMTCLIRPISDLIEADIPWDYKSLQAEIGQVYNEDYADKEEDDTEAPTATL